MDFGLCCADPTPFALERIQAAFPGCVLRFDCRLEDDAKIEADVERVRQAGFVPLPILAIPYPSPRMDDDEINRYAGWCGRLVDRLRLPRVEILNEPFIKGEWPPDWYHWTARATCLVLRQDCPDTQILLAGEMLSPDRQGAKKNPWWQQATQALQLDQALYDGVALHPYREPGPPTAARIGGKELWGFLLKKGTRRAEYDWCRSEGCGKPLFITEVGWNLGRGISEADQARYLVEELDIAEANGAELVCVYAAVSAGGKDDFGIWRDDGTEWLPRPAVAALTDWRRRHTTAT